jgi:hypothetical protein
MSQVDKITQQAQQISNMQEQLTQLMPIITIASATLVLIIVTSGILGALKRRKINKAILNTQQEVKDIKALLQKQSSSYLSNVSSTSPTPHITVSPQDTQSTTEHIEQK